MHAISDFVPLCNNKEPVCHHLLQNRLSDPSCAQIFNAGHLRQASSNTPPGTQLTLSPARKSSWQLSTALPSATMWPGMGRRPSGLRVGCRWGPCRSPSPPVTPPPSRSRLSLSKKLQLQVLLHVPLSEFQHKIQMPAATRTCMVIGYICTKHWPA